MRTSTYLGAGWHGWFHVVGNTYGTWLYGDPRGFRTRHHRQHVEGDYRHPPPPGAYEALRLRSQRAMAQRGRKPVVLSWEARVEACRAFVAALRFHHVEVIDLAITARHYHLLARFPCTLQWIARVTGSQPHGLQSVGFHRHDRSRRRSALDDPPRHYTGIAKKESACALSRAGLIVSASGRVWARRCHAVPIEHRSHQLHVVQYIRGHARQGAAVCSMLHAAGALGDNP